jgi:cytochrome P450
MKSVADIPRVGSAREQLRAMRHDRLGALLRFNDDPGDIGRFDVAFGAVVLVNSPELVHDVLVTRAKSFEKSPVLRAALYPLAGVGLFTSEGDLWKRQRKVMAPLFPPGAIARFAKDMTDCAEHVVATWRSGEVVDIARETTHITMAVAGKTLFDIDTFGEADELGAALTTALEWAGTEVGGPLLVAQARAKIGLDLLADRVPENFAPHVRSAADRLNVPLMLPTKKNRELRAALDILEARVTRMIAARRADPKAHRDLLSILLSARTEDGEAMSDRQVRDEVLTLFVAGHETTANALAWALMLLAQHRDVYRRLREEVDAIGRVPTFEDLPRLQLALRVFKESLRLYPPVYLFGRVTLTDVDIGEYHLPKGTIVLVSPFALQRRPSLWPDPERFDPERFTPENEAKRHKTAFLPFSAGPRTCIGNHFALMEGPLVLATLLHYVDVDLCEAKGSEPEALATLRPKGGVRMRITARR